MDTFEEKVAYLDDNSFEEIDALDYFRDLFPVGSCQQNNTDHTQKGNVILQYRPPAQKYFRNKVVFDDLSAIKKCLCYKGEYAHNEFVIISPCTYFGKKRLSKYASMCYGIIIDIDNVGQRELENLLNLFYAKIVPMPTAIVISGNGVHVTYMFAEAVKIEHDPDDDKKTGILTDIKYAITDLIWNDKTSKKMPREYQPIVQGYRAPGTLTKNGYLAKAFRLGPKIFFEELVAWYNFDNPKHKVMPRTRLADAKELWPVWYKNIVVLKKEKGHLHIGRKMYDKWLEAITEKAEPGHRYFCILALAAIARKCDVPFAELESDAYKLLPIFDARTIDSKNNFTAEDVDNALEMYFDFDKSIKRKVSKIEKDTGISYPRVEKRDRPGRPDAANIVLDYLDQHPSETNISKIARDCNITRDTVYKYIKIKPIDKSDKIKAYISDNPNEKSVTKIAKACNVSRTTVYKYLD